MVFLRVFCLQASATRQDLDDVALPMLVVYKAGEIEHCLARVHEEFSDSFTVDDVEWVLENKGVLEPLKASGTTAPGGKVGLTMARYDHAIGRGGDI